MGFTPKVRDEPLAVLFVGSSAGFLQCKPFGRTLSPDAQNQVCMNGEAFSGQARKRSSKKFAATF